MQFVAQRLVIALAIACQTSKRWISGGALRRHLGRQAPLVGQLGTVVAVIGEVLSLPEPRVALSAKSYPALNQIPIAQCYAITSESFYSIGSTFRLNGTSFNTTLSSE